VVWLGTHGLAGLAKAMVGLVLAGAAAGVLAGLAHRATPPPFAEFDGQVIRQWMVKGDSESPDEWHVAVDDGTRETAWDFDVGGERYRRPAGPGGPGVADGYLIGQAAGVIVPPLIVILSVHGTIPGGLERLTALLPVVEGRLREVATRMSRPTG
jgi:hypothetical protein